MSYVSVIPLATAKEYLRVDSGFTSDDTAITRHIGSALSFIEEYTNVLVFARDKNYLLVDGCARIYDNPFNSYVEAGYTEDEFEIIRKPGYYIYEKGSETIEITLNVGYELPSDVPENLIDVALEIIEGLYTGNKLKDSISDWGYEVLNRHKKFML